MGRSRRSQLFPLFRSEAQARVLSAVYLAPEDRAPHVAVIAEETGLAYSTVQREVAALEDAGLVRSTTVGRAKVVRPDTASPVYDELASLVLKTYGPATLLGNALRGSPGVVEAYIFGSWAARYHGERGADPGDIDVLVVLSDPGADAGADADAIEDVLTPIEKVLGREINVVFTREREWSTQSSPFLQTVKARPLVAVAGDLDDG